MIPFPLFVRLIGDALLEHDGKGHQAFVRAIEGGQLEASMQAAYGKIQRVPISLSTGFLADSTARLQPLFPTTVASPVPACFDGWNVINIDGKNLNRELINQGYGQYQEHLGGAEAQEMFGTAGKTIGVGGLQNPIHAN